MPGLFRVVYEVLMRGSPDDYTCISRLRESLVSSGAVCVGHQLMQLCSYGEVMVKLTPFAERAILHQHVLGERITLPQLYLVIEGVRPGDVVRAADAVYRSLRECGIALKLVVQPGG